MADFLVNLSQNAAAKNLLSKAGVPLPTKLRRARGPWVARPLDNLPVAVGVAPGGVLHTAVADTLGRAGADVHLVGSDAVATAFVQAAEGWGRPLHLADPLTEGTRPHALVFDATGLQSAEDLALLHGFFHPTVRSLRSGGRVVVLGAPPEAQATPAAAAAQAALDGFVRSLGKELGRKGSTATRIVVEDGAEDQLEPVLRWVLSDRSSFFDLQTVPVRASVGGAAPAFTRPLEGKVALVTGAARGIGAETARRLSQEGAKVIVLDRPDDLEGAASLAQAVRGIPLGLDITDADAGERLVAFLAEHTGGRVDVVVHNAGVTRDKTLGRMDADRWHLAVDVNLGAVLRLTAHLDATGALADHGRVVLLSSIAGIAGNAGQTNYAASKAGLLGALPKLADQLGRRGITVNAVAPGFIETRLTAAIPAAIREAGRRLSALSQGGMPVDIAEMVTFLASPGAAGVHGAALRVCGGGFLGA